MTKRTTRPSRGSGRRWVGACLAAVLFARAANAQARDVAAPRVDTGSVAVDGSRLYYEAAGHGPVVVLLHAGNLDRRVWDPQFLPLARAHRVIRYDLRGYGRSGPADAPFQHDGDLRALLDSLGIRRASLVGLSGGARIAIDFVLAHPERVERLVLASPGLSGWAYADAADTMYFAEARRARDRGDAAALGIAWLGSAYMRPAMEHPELVAPLREMAAANGKVWMSRLRHGEQERVADPPALHRTGELRVPTLVVVGTRDTPDIRAIADTLAATVPGLRRVWFEGAGHLPNMEQPPRFTALVAAFLRPHPPNARRGPRGRGAPARLGPDRPRRAALGRAP